MRREYKVEKVEIRHLQRFLNLEGLHGWRLVSLGDFFSVLHCICVLEREAQALPTSITFQETTMNPTEAGQDQTFTGTLSPAGSTTPPDATFSVSSNDPAIKPAVDSTGLIVTVTYPDGWVESTTTPLQFAYAAASASNPSWSLSATITPSAPPELATGITFAQTT